MRYALYFLIYSCVVVGLFATFLYLMTVVDPGLLQLSEKAEKMMRTHAEGVHDSTDELPAEMYIDFSDLANRSSNLVLI